MNELSTKIKIGYTYEEVTAWSRTIDLIGPDDVSREVVLMYNDGNYELIWVGKDGLDVDAPTWADDLDLFELDLISLGF